MKDLEKNNLDIPDTAHSSNSEDTNAVYEEFLRSMENLALEIDEEEEVKPSVATQSAATSIEATNSENNLSVDVESDSDNNVAADNDLLLFADLDSSEPSAEISEIDGSMDNASVDNYSSAAVDYNEPLNNDSFKNNEALDDKDDSDTSANDTSSTATKSKSILSRFKKPKKSRALRDKTILSTPIKKTKADKKDKKTLKSLKAIKTPKASKAEKTTKAPKNRTLMIILGGLLLTLALVFLLMSTDVLSTFTDDLTADDSSEAVSPEIADPEPQNTEVTDASVESEAAVDIDAPIPETNVADEAADSAPPSDTAPADAQNAQDAQDAQNAVISYEEFTKEADSTLYRDSKD